MSILARTFHKTDVNAHRDGSVTGSPAAETSYALSSPARKALGLLRIAFGFTFLWAFVDKMFGLGYATKSADSWLNGGSPTEGFLKFGAKGPFKGFYNSIAGDTLTNVLFMAALLALGVALILGIGMRLAGIGGTILYLMMFTVALPPANNPIMDEHILGAISIAALSLSMAGNTWGFGHMWANTPLAKKFPILR